MGKNTTRRTGRRNTTDGNGIKFVFDSTPLIHLVKAGLQTMIKKLDGEKYLTPAVHKEVVKTGKEKGFDDAFVTEELIERNVLKVEKPDKDLLDLTTRHEDIHLGEAEILSLAKDLKGIAITDDPIARAVADMYEVQREGSYMIILRMLNSKKINKEKAKSSLKKLVKSGWRCDVELYETILRKIEEL